MSESLVLTIPEAAKLLAIGRTAAYEAARRGEIPAVRIGRSWRVPRQALEELLTTTATGTDSPQTNGAGYKPAP